MVVMATGNLDPRDEHAGQLISGVLQDARDLFWAEFTTRHPGHDGGQVSAGGGALPTARGRRTSRPRKLSMSAIFL